MTAFERCLRCGGRTRRGAVCAACLKLESPGNPASSLGSDNVPSALSDDVLGALSGAMLSVFLVFFLTPQWLSPDAGESRLTIQAGVRTGPVTSNPPEPKLVVFGSSGTGPGHGGRIVFPSAGTNIISTFGAGTSTGTTNLTVYPSFTVTNSMAYDTTPHFYQPLPCAEGWSRDGYEGNVCRTPCGAGWDYRGGDCHRSKR